MNNAFVCFYLLELGSDEKDLCELVEHPVDLLMRMFIPVSYTHLTLPTIYSV